MKNFKLETKSLSKKTDLKIQLNIYVIFLKKHINNIFWLGFVIPVFIFSIAIFWIFKSFDVNNTSQNSLIVHKNIKVRLLVDSTLSSKYKNKAKKRSQLRKAERYKIFAMARSAKVRQR